MQICFHLKFSHELRILPIARIHSTHPVIDRPPTLHPKPRFMWLCTATHLKKALPQSCLASCMQTCHAKALEHSVLPQDVCRTCYTSAGVNFR